MVAARRVIALQADAGPLVLQAQDIVLTLGGTLAGALLVFSGTGRQQLGWQAAALAFFATALAPFLFRTLQHRFPSELTRFLATFIPPTLGVLAIYSHLDPLCDLLNPHLADAQLAAIDRAAFGVNPGLWLEQRTPAPVLDALYVCYTSYYFWPVSIGLILFAQGKERVAAFDRYILGYVLLMLTSYALYLTVPAIGPRFFLAAEYAGPVRAGPLGRWFDTLFRGAPYFRDCFPSGHTALTLYALYQARRLTPGWFKVMVIPASGLIAATLVCRFHYAVDLAGGGLLTFAVVLASEALHARLPAIAFTRQRVAIAASTRAP
jgi:hypothetical protein